jgi:hypothetical protein
MNTYTHVTEATQRLAQGGDGSRRQVRDVLSAGLAEGYLPGFRVTPALESIAVAAGGLRHLGPCCIGVRPFVFGGNSDAWGRFCTSWFTSSVIATIAPTCLCTLFAVFADFGVFHA